MFDTLYVRCALPLTEELKKLDVKWNEISYQTKDLTDSLATYEITAEGELIYFNDSWWEEAAFKKDKSKISHHGKIVFYEYIENVDGYDWFIDFHAYFTYGKLDKITLGNIDKQATTLRLARESLWKHERNMEQRKFSSKLKCLLRSIPGYSYFLKKLSKAVNSTGNKIYMFLLRWS